MSCVVGFHAKAIVRWISDDFRSLLPKIISRMVFIDFGNSESHKFKISIYNDSIVEEWPVLNIDNLEDSDTQSPSYYLWRNVFSAINLLRVLNKLTKWKHARTMMLVVFKSAPILKRSLRVKLVCYYIILNLQIIESVNILFLLI